MIPGEGVAQLYVAVPSGSSLRFSVVQIQGVAVSI